MNKEYFLQQVGRCVGESDACRVEHVTTAVLDVIDARSGTQGQGAGHEPWGTPFLARLLHRLATPFRLDHAQFLVEVRTKAGLATHEEAERFSRAVFHALKTHITEGESWKVARYMPSAMRRFWVDS